VATGDAPAPDSYWNSPLRADRATASDRRDRRRAPARCRAATCRRRCWRASAPSPRRCSAAV